MNPYKYGQLIFDKNALRGENIVFSTNGAGAKGIYIYKIEPRHRLTTLTIIGSGWMIDLSGKSKTSRRNME